MLPRPPRPTLFPYTTLFRSILGWVPRLRRMVRPAMRKWGVRLLPTRRKRIGGRAGGRSEEHTSELQSRLHLVCRLLLEKKKEQEEKRARGVPVNTARAYNVG